MRGVNKVFLIGNATRDAELQHTQNGKAEVGADSVLTLTPCPQSLPGARAGTEGETIVAVSPPHPHRDPRGLAAGG
jgi:single-stranded DNA-binding protein